MSYRILSLADSALTVEFGERVDPALQAAVAALDAAVARACAAGALPGVIETVPTFRSLTVLYDPLRTARADLEAALATLLERRDAVSRRAGRRWLLPVHYGGADGPDLESLAAACGVAPQAAVELHGAQDYAVYMLGFLPGFPFMGDVPSSLAQPRRREPRLRVPAGSVAVAGTLTAVYPWDSPGGWHLIGRCPVPLFSAAWPQPALLLPGDRVRFRAACDDECRAIAERLAAPGAGALPPTEFLVP